MGADRLPLGLLCSQSGRPAGRLYALPGAAAGVRLQRRQCSDSPAHCFFGSTDFAPRSPGFSATAGQRPGLIVGSLLSVEHLHGPLGTLAERHLPACLPRVARHLRIALHARGLRPDGERSRPGDESKAVAIFATSQMVGVAVGGSFSGYVAERLPLAGLVLAARVCGAAVSLCLSHRFFRTVPTHFKRVRKLRIATVDVKKFSAAVSIPSLRIVTLFAACSTFGLFLVYTWLPTFLYDKFSLGLARAGFEASIYPQIGTLAGLIAGGALADRLYTR